MQLWGRKQLSDLELKLDNASASSQIQTDQLQVEVRELKMQNQELQTQLIDLRE